MIKEIWFDMDGTITDLYGVEDWLSMLRNYDPTPYKVAKPLLHMASLARRLNALQRKGYTIGIVSWVSKVSTPEYDEAVATAKIDWLRTHLKSVKFDHIDILPYGTPKQNGRNGILFDDNKEIREDWADVAFTEKDIMKVLGALA